MKRLASATIGLFILAAMCAPAAAQITYEDIYREISARVGPFNGGIDDGDHDETGTLDLGIYETAVSATWESGSAQADHVSTVTLNGEVLRISGNLQSEAGRALAGDRQTSETRHLFLADIDAAGPFEIAGNLVLTGADHISYIRIVDESVDVDVFTTGVNPASGEFSAVCSLFGPYRLEVVHLVSMHREDAFDTEATLVFELAIGPVGTVPAEGTSWSAIKTLFR